jgi:hypothetical protein
MYLVAVNKSMLQTEKIIFVFFLHGGGNDIIMAAVAE